MTATVQEAEETAYLTVAPRTGAFTRQTNVNSPTIGYPNPGSGAGPAAAGQAPAQVQP
jgi:hypothetical protein